MRIRYCVLMLIVVGLLATATICAGESVPPVTLQDFPVESPEAHWIWSLLTNDTVHTAILWVLGAGVAGVIGWLKWQGSVKAKALQCLAAGVRETYEAYVRPAKIANADGKLTDDERQESVRQAIERGRAFAADQGIDLLKTLGKALLPMLVDWIVKLFKGESSSKSPLAESPPQLPGLEP